MKNKKAGEGDIPSPDLTKNMNYAQAPHRKKWNDTIAKRRHHSNEN